VRGVASAITLALAGGCALAMSAVHADTLEAPAQVVAQVDGSFAYSCTFRKGAGTAQLAAYGWSGMQNVQGGMVGDCFCLPFCPVFAPGDTFALVVSGQLVSPNLPGLVAESVSLCTSSGAAAMTTVQPHSVTGVEGPASAGDVRLWNEPNPFSNRTTFHYRLPAAGLVRLSVHDLAGRLVARLVEEVEPAGPHQVTWEVRGIPGAPARGGVWFARLTVGGLIRTRPLILVP